MLRDNLGLEIRGLEQAPIPVHVHVARATFATGLVSKRFDGSMADAYDRVREAWREGVSVVVRPRRVVLDTDIGVRTIRKMRIV
jgi:hypothetical protein